MKIDILQIQNEKRNEFEIRYNDTLQYKAKLPFVSIHDPLDLEKLKTIKIFDTNENEIYTTNYQYIENFKEEFIPMKFLVTGSQKFNQLLFISNQKTIKIYYEDKAIWDNRYVIEINGKKYFCYSIQDGYIQHFPIYDGDIQIGEALKSNVVIDFKDEYCCYLKDTYESLSDGIVALLLYLDRSDYSSSYLVQKSYHLSKEYSYNKTNQFYDKEWVKNNFGDEFYLKVDENVKFVKEKLRHPFKTLQEQWNSMPDKSKKLLRFVLFAPWIIIFIILFIVLMGILFSH